MFWSCSEMKFLEFLFESINIYTILVSGEFLKFDIQIWISEKFLLIDLAIIDYTVESLDVWSFY